MPQGDADTRWDEDGFSLVDCHIGSCRRE
jgi:hypothetical protein